MRYLFVFLILLIGATSYSQCISTRDGRVVVITCGDWEPPEIGNWEDPGEPGDGKPGNSSGNEITSNTFFRIVKVYDINSRTNLPDLIYVSTFTDFNDISVQLPYAHKQYKVCIEEANGHMFCENIIIQ